MGYYGLLWASIDNIIYCWLGLAPPFMGFTELFIVAVIQEVISSSNNHTCLSISIYSSSLLNAELSRKLRTKKYNRIVTCFKAGLWPLI